MTCPVCRGKGKILSAETIAFRLERELWEKPFQDHEAILIDVTENVKSIFCGHQDIHLKRLEDLLHIEIIFNVIENVRPCYKIRQFGTKKEMLTKLHSY